MSNANQPSLTQPEGSRRSGLMRIVLAEWPYALLLIAAIVGIAITDMKLEIAPRYWQFLIPVFAIFSLVLGWKGAGTSGRSSFVVKTLLHWGALLVVVQILFYVPEMLDVLNAELTGLQIVFLLGLTAFLAGIHGDWRMAVIGVFLVAGGILVAFLDDAALMVSVIAVGLLIVSILWRKFVGEKSAD